MAIKVSKRVDHYKVLGLPSSGENRRNLTIAEVKKAYRRKTLEFHPDKRPNDPHAKAKFQMLQFSQDFLLDRLTRRKIVGENSEQYRKSSPAEESGGDWSGPEWDSDPDAEERRRNSWREFLKNHPSRFRDLHMRRSSFWRKSFWKNS